MSKMAFETPEQRAEVLQDIHDGGGVPLGTAMAHARWTRLGMVGDREVLRRDCAVLLIGELRTAERETPSTVYAYDYRMTLQEAILACPEFDIAYRCIRRKVEHEQEQHIRKALGWEPLPALAPQTDKPVDDDALAGVVADALALKRRLA